MPVRVYDRRFDASSDHFAFVPDPLPDTLHLSADSWAAATSAATAIARLDGAASELPSPFLVARPIIRREAVSTSALEGTYSPLEEVLGAEATKDVGRPETLEVLNYVAAVDRGLELLRERPVSRNMILRLHETLLDGVRGESWQLGKVRTHQNWIGPKDCRLEDSTFVPPPPEGLDDRISAWETWIHREDLPVVVRAALGHYQFETLHPFNDGNGRLGRLVVVLQLIEDGLLRDHLMSISPYLEGQRDTYIEQLRRLTVTGDFDRWLQFFSGVLQRSATESLDRIRTVQEVRDQAVETLREANVKGVAVQITSDLVGWPVLTARDAADRYGVSYQAARGAIEKLVNRGILSSDEASYNRVYFSPRLLSALR